MNIAAIFIRRPVATVLLMLGMHFFGMTGYKNLPVNHLPNVVFPTIQVMADLAGADADRQGDPGQGAGRRQRAHVGLRLPGQGL